MDNLKPVSNIDASELPPGFSLSDPNGSNNNGNSTATQQQQSAQRDEILQQALTPDALARLRRVQLVKPNKTLENAIIQMLMSGKLTSKITEDKLIEMLERQGMAKQRKTETIKIERKKYAFDSDDDDNDDDLM